MSIDPAILAVQRPVNTVVEDRKRDTPKRYAVRERAGYKRSASGNSAPKNGKVIGYIIDMKYVPKTNKASLEGPNFLSYGSAALVFYLSEDLLQDLLQVFPPNEAYSIYCAAALRVIYPGVTDGRLASRYRNSYLCQFLPGAALSKNTMTSLENRIGHDPQKRKAFYACRLAQMMGNTHIAIDGMLKQDNSSVNDLSAFSYKGRTKGVKDISIIYAYDIDRMEPVAAEVFAGNKIDAGNYADFLQRTGVDNCVIIADKGFPISCIEGLLAQKPGISYLSPLKRNDTRIVNNKMYDFDGVLIGTDRTIQYKKAPIKGGHILYSFCDVACAKKEEQDWIERNKDPQTGSYDTHKYAKKKPTFGTVVFISDLDMEPVKAYRCYEERWMIETVFNHYKNDIDLDVTRVQSDGTVIGSEFINFISVIMTCRIIKKANKAGIFERMTYQQLIEDLRAIQRFTAGGTSLPDEKDAFWNNPTQAEWKLIRELGLCTPTVENKPKRKRTSSASAQTSAVSNAPKRGRGRPRKNPVVVKPKRPRGRPRKDAGV